MVEFHSIAEGDRTWILELLIRIWCGILGFISLLHAIRDKGNYRLGLYEFEDESDIPLSRGIGRLWYFVIGLALVVGAIFIDDPRW